MSRRHAYYWKCDEPLALRHGEEASEQEQQAWDAMAFQIARETMGQTLVRLEPGPLRNRHRTYLIHCTDGTHFLRADTSDVADDYMLAESHVMEVLRHAGVPVPAVLATDTTRALYPMRYQIVERVPYQSLHLYDQKNELDRLAIGRQLGRCMAQVHSVQAPGFGFIDTAGLKADRIMRGLDAKASHYFLRRLENHLGELAQSGLLPAAEVQSIGEMLHAHLPLTEIAVGRLVHRDLAFWNMLGTADRLHAIVDWEDVVLGDPMDDLGVINCFYDRATIQAIAAGYAEMTELPNDFDARLWLYTLRNMVWKAALRHRMKYFEQGNAAFISSRENKTSLRAFTIDRIREAVAGLRRATA